MKSSKKNQNRIIKITLLFIIGAIMLTGCSPYKNSRYIELGEYMNLQLDYSLIAVTAQDMENEINLLLDKYADNVVFDEGTVQIKDIANIDYSGTVDDMPFEGGAATGYDLEIGSNLFIPGFEEGL
ncbi:MAG: hypothetical protein PHN87_02725, partial [Clostridia bacterium]|nr:hypothetical protein [Clostridia bacterium]